MRTLDDAARAFVAWTMLEGAGVRLDAMLEAHLVAISRFEATPDAALLARGVEATFAPFSGDDWYDGGLCEAHAELQWAAAALVSADAIGARERAGATLVRHRAYRRRWDLAHELGYRYDPGMPERIEAEERAAVDTHWKTLL